jgi:hypothetical protein
VLPVLKERLVELLALLEHLVLLDLVVAILAQPARLD